VPDVFEENLPLGVRDPFQKMLLIASGESGIAIPP
jgi:hypothetical protein